MRSLCRESAIKKMIRDEGILMLFAAGQLGLDVMRKLSCRLHTTVTDGLEVWNKVKISRRRIGFPKPDN